jgi:hypothetical protein
MGRMTTTLRGIPSMTRRVLFATFVTMAGAAAAGAHRLTALAEAAPSSASANTGVDKLSDEASVDSIFGVFEGRTPCGDIANEFTQFPAQGCEKIKWELTLHRNPATRQPTTYLYRGTRSTRQGAWRIEQDAGPERRVLYHLQYGSPAKVLSVLSVEGNVLLLLDRNLHVLVGDASWSYVLNRKP